MQQWGCVMCEQEIRHDEHVVIPINPDDWMTIDELLEGLE